MKITLKAKDSGLDNYTSTTNCPIARGLRRKGILSLVGPYDWFGLFLGFIPCWGQINTVAGDKAYNWAHHKQLEDETIILN